MQIKSLVVVAAAAIATASAAECDAATTSTAFGSLAVLLSNPNLKACSDASGYDMMNSPSLPTSAQNDKMCAKQECHQLMKDIAKLSPPDCTLKVPTSGAVLNIKSLVDGFEPGCKSETPAPTTAAPAVTSAAPSASSAAPSASSAAPSASSKAPSASSAAPSASSQAPSPSQSQNQQQQQQSKTPAPTKSQC